VRAKEEILEHFRTHSDDYWFESLLLEVLCDIRDKLEKVGGSP